MNLKEARISIDTATKLFDTLGSVRRKLVGQELTFELFDELNGAERGIEQLLNRDVDISFSNISDVAALKADIFDAISREEMEIGKTIHAALECYCDHLVTIISDYDAYADENLELRRKLEEKIKSLNKEGKESLLKERLDFECFSYTNALQIIELMNDLTKFFGSETCNLKILTTLQMKNGSDMTEEEISFLDTLTKVSEQDVRRPGWAKLDIIYGDRLTDAKIETLGFDAKNIVEVSKMLTKTEGTYFKMVRDLREALVHTTATTDEVSVRNTRFYRAVEMLMYYAKDISGAAKALSQQLTLTCKKINAESLVHQKKEASNTDVDNNGDQHDANNPPSLEGDDKSADNPPEIEE